MTHRRVLLAILLLALVLRLALAVELGDGVVGPQQERAQDQVTYDALAKSILAGKGYSFDQDWYPGFTKAGIPTAHWSFLYPLYLGGIYAIFGTHPLAARLLQVLITGLLCILLVYRLGARLWSRNAGLAAAFLWAVYAYFIYYDAALMTESFFTIGILTIFELSFELVGINVERPNSPASNDTRIWIALGIVLGLTTLLRQTLLLFLPFWLIWIYWARNGQPGRFKPMLSLAIMALIIMPWMVRNYFVYHAFLPLNSNAGYAFFSANHPNHGTQFDQDYVAPLPADLINKDLNEAQWNTALTQRGLEFILADPQRYIFLCLDRVPIFFNAGFSPESSLASNMMRVLSFGLYLPFFVYGMIISLREPRRFMLIYLFVAIFSAVHILVWASVRYRLPVDAVMMPLAAMAIVDLAHRLGLKFPKTVSA